MGKTPFVAGFAVGFLVVIFAREPVTGIVARVVFLYESLNPKSFGQVTDAHSLDVFLPEDHLRRCQPAR